MQEPGRNLSRAAMRKRRETSSRLKVANNENYVSIRNNQEVVDSARNNGVGFPFAIRRQKIILHIVKWAFHQAFMARPLHSVI